MQLAYDPDTDVLRIVLGSEPVSRRSGGEAPGLSLGLDGNGSVVDLEITQASRRIDNPKSVDFAVAGRCVRGMRMF
jgi:uncharacterized protein YuzE